MSNIWQFVYTKLSLQLEDAEDEAVGKWELRFTNRVARDDEQEKRLLSLLCWYASKRDTGVGDGQN